MALSKGEDAGDLYLVVHERPVELSPDVSFLLVFFGMTHQLDVADGIDTDAFELEM